MSDEINDFEIQDDLPVTEDYPTQDLTPKPPLPGNYLFKTAKWSMRTRKDGGLVLYKNSNGDPTYPVIGLTTVEITDPIDNQRKVVLFQDIPTIPFTRGERRASRAADMLRSFDHEAAAANTGEILHQLKDKMDNGLEFKGRLDYTGYDAEFARQQIEAAGGKDNLDKKQLNELYAKAKIRGYKNIQKANRAAGKGTLPIHKWVGPSGNIIDVKPEISIFYPSDEQVNLGPDKALL